MEITLADLTMLEPRLRPEDGPSAGGASQRMAHEPVSWAVTARTTLPYLPPLRGGELLLLPERAIAAIGDELPALIRESVARDVSGIVFPTLGEGDMHAGSDDVCVFHWDETLTADTETDLNRRLTECRGELYRIGTELERRRADLAANEAGLEALARIVEETTGLSMTVVDAQDRQLVGTPGDSTGGAASSRDAAGEIGRLDASSHGLTRGATLVLGAGRTEHRIVARFLVDRIASAANSALQRDDAARPRGSQRAEATASLLGGGRSASDQRSRALALGLDPDAVFFVVVSDVESAATLARVLAPLGKVHPAGGSNGHRVALVAAGIRKPSETVSGRIQDISARWEREPETERRLLALSGAAFGVASLPRAAREADFVAAMQSIGDVPRRVAAFGSVDDLGAMGLLYHLRETPELRGFVSEALGALPARDQRGTLRATLRAFLESGGSQVDASQRLGIHRNTLSYRLRRIGELIGRDVADPTAWLTLHLAIRASDMLEVFPDER